MVSLDLVAPQDHLDPLDLPDSLELMVPRVMLGPLDRAVTQDPRAPQEVTACPDHLVQWDSLESPGRMVPVVPREAWVLPGLLDLQDFLVQWDPLDL